MSATMQRLLDELEHEINDQLLDLYDKKLLIQSIREKLATQTSVRPSAEPTYTQSDWGV
jgi:hypothetical protein